MQIIGHWAPLPMTSHQSNCEMAIIRVSSPNMTRQVVVGAAHGGLPLPKSTPFVTGDRAATVGCPYDRMLDQATQVGKSRLAKTTNPTTAPTDPTTPSTTILVSGNRPAERAIAGS